MLAELLARALEALREEIGVDDDGGSSIHSCDDCPPDATVEFTRLWPEVDGSYDPSTGDPPFCALARTPYTERVAYRIIKVRFSPREFFANKTVRWTFIRDYTRNLRGAMGPDHPARFEEVRGYTSRRLNSRGETVIRVNMPAVAFNKGTVTVTSTDCPCVYGTLEVEVPAVVVIDPGHGGESGSIDGSDANHASGWWPSDATLPRPLEKDLTLDLARRVVASLWARALVQGSRVKAIMTRTADNNLGLTARANVARDNGADVLLSIHFNGFDGIEWGTLAFIDNVGVETAGDEDYDQDTAFADRVQARTAAALRVFKSDSYERIRYYQGLGVLSDTDLGNDDSPNRIRASLLEVEFIDNEAVSRLWNIGEIPSEQGEEEAETGDPQPPGAPGQDVPQINQQNVALVRNAVAAAIAGAIIEDLQQQPSPWRGTAP